MGSLRDIAQENEIKLLRTKLQNDENVKLFNRHKQEQDEICDDIAEGIRIRSRCQWYEKGEKSNKFFLILKNNVEFKVNYKKLK